MVACVCIHLACKWSNWEIPVSTDGKHWWEYVDRTVTLQLLDGEAALLLQFLCFSFLLLSASLDNLLLTLQFLTEGITTLYNDSSNYVRNKV